MTNEEVAELKIGDVVRHTTGLHFVVVNTAGRVPQAVALIHLVRPEDFEAVEVEGEAES